ncbi:MAG: aspartate aminotransferase family protein [Hadesarchaea archaeon]|nr:aspartate aminotransferase family protein [Hadesarchaea archaeon]
MKFNRDLEEKYIAPTYKRQPIAVKEGNGVIVKDDEGKEYIDFVGGLAVCSLGHSHPALSKAICEQAKKLTHISNLYHIPPQAELAEKLAEITPGKINKFFFCNSGTEAVESALKLAIKHTKRKKVIAFEGSFHGRTSASVGATWNKSYKKPFEALIPPIFEFSPFDDLVSARNKIDDKTAAIIIEPIQGEGGVNVPSDDFLPGLREICDENNVLMISDEVQAGMGRTGKWFACENWGVKPDIITMAKALGNGFPIGCMGAKNEVMNSFTPGDHASTFGGNPLACTVGKTVIDTMKNDEILARAQEIGSYFKKELEELVKEHEICSETRGIGLMLALELKEKKIAESVLKKIREKGFLINLTAEKVLRFVPPLIVKKKHINKLISTLSEVLEEVS